MTEPENILGFPKPKALSEEEEQLNKVKAEAERLANQPEFERYFWLPKRAEQIKVSPSTLKAAVTAIIKQRTESEAAERLQQTHKSTQHEKQRSFEDKRERQDAKDKEREQQRLKKEKEQEKKQAEQERTRKEKEKRKCFANLARLPVARHQKEFERLAEQLSEDIAALRKEFETFTGVGTGEPPAVTEPWPEPVDAAVLFQELSTKVLRYVVLQPNHLTAGVLWAAHSWLYDHGVPTHSPMLAATSAEPDSGKTTFVAVLGRIAPRYVLNVEMNGPNLYRQIDAIKPTLVMDEAGDLFTRRSDLKHIINQSWTCGAKIPRQASINGVWQTVYFDPFCPKMIALLGRNLPTATRTRSIELRMLPKRSNEQVEPFSHLDDSEFAVLRQKLARWAADNGKALKEAKPVMPSDLNNRAAANWRLLFVIAENVGGDWPRQALEAAERLTRTGRRPSDGVQLLTVFKELFAKGHKKFVTSEAVVAHLGEDPTSIWADFNHGGVVTQRQVAHMLDAFDIHPQQLHPTGRGDFSRRGYSAEQFVDAFARYVPNDPIIQSHGVKRGVKREKLLKKRKTKTKTKRR
jgi:hypothetical protein